LNPNGNVEWRKSIGGINDETANDILTTYDNGFVIVRNTKSFGAGGSDFYIIKTDSSGNILWTKTIGGNLNDNAYSVFETSNKDLIVAGLTTETDIDILITRLDKNGNIKWANKYGNFGNDRANSILENSNNEIIVCGQYNDQDLLLIKTDSTGNVLWSKIFGNSINAWGYSINTTSENNLLICGQIKLSSMEIKSLIFKTNLNGDTIWTRIYGNELTQFPTHIEQNFDQSIFFTGYTQKTTTDYDFLLVKTDSLGKTI